MLPNKPGRRSKLQQQLTKQQSEQLARWLTQKNALTYQQAITRLKEEFGVVAGLANLSSFYHSVCSPRLAKRNQKSNPVLLNVILKRRAKGGLQIMILEASARVALHGHKNLKALVRRGRGA